MRTWGFAVVALALGACGDDNNATIDAPTGGDATDAPTDSPMIDAPFAPMKLSDTGLCVDAACTQITAGIHEYAPQYPLYADGSTKRRWISLPPGTTIDTSNMNHWKFPVGTRLWKEFTRGAIRVETRFMTKLLADDAAPGAWFFASFEWNTTQTDTTLAPPGAGVPNANGTQHDIPSRANCRRCHEQVAGRVLGFQAISLDFDGAVGSLDLADAVSMNLLSVPPTAPTTGPYFPFPAAATAVDKAAFGYLHANCGGCHNPQSTVSSGLTSNLDLRLDVTKLGTVAEIPARATTLNNPGTVSGLTGPIVDPGNPNNSVMLTRMSSLTFPVKMPEIGTEVTDPDGIAAITAWISQPP